MGSFVLASSMIAGGIQAQEINVQTGVHQVIKKHFRLTANPKNSDKLVDLGADSLDTVEIIMSLEGKFDIEIPDEKASQFKTVGHIVTYIKKNPSSQS